ncbi:hypothetical protein BX600DRAFT_432792 [Xylariales sp. PMI_506]|nr:hypothetical protein BX600DRAFT_432792 [Xylariales sp. PMI_506]
MNIMNLPPELLIELAERMNIPTLWSLMATNKRIYTNIRAYERSICKARVEDFLLSPLAKVLSSYGQLRRVYLAGSFTSIAELELRDARIDFILQSGFVALACPMGPDPLTLRQQRRYAALLRRALYHCDRIADIAANNTVSSNGPSQERQDQLVVWNDSKVDSLATGYILDPLENARARALQISYLRTLPLADLAGMYCMIQAMSDGWLRAEPWIEYDELVAELVTVFEECVLRHGTWFLRAQVAVMGVDFNCDRDRSTSSLQLVQAEPAVADSLKRVSSSMLSAGMAELKDWETGKLDMQPGLRMSILEAAQTRIHEMRQEQEKEQQHNGENHEEAVDSNAAVAMYQLVRKTLFGGEQKDARRD